ncbi:MAG: gluconate 2-dehydrogenase subunit 3 family protein [Pseudomonadota bacterium]
MQTDQSRRRFLHTGTGAVSASWLAAQWPLALKAAEQAAAARDSQRPFQHLGTAEAKDFEAIAARIVPTTDTPGAREIGVIYYIDTAIGGWMEGVEQMLRPALADLNATVTERYGAQHFHLLDGEAQDALLGEIEAGPLFQTLRFMTLCGCFALPSYGGNRNRLGWALIGFDHRHVWFPPFGHYDAGHHEARAAAPAPRQHSEPQRHGR